MTWWQAIILGLVQGATEFLPISSSGHLILIRYWMGLSGDYLLFDSLLHLATLFAIAIVLRRDIISLWKPPFKTVGWIILATIPAIITGFLLKPMLEVYFDTPRFLWIFFFATAVLLIITELLSKRNAKKAEAAGQTGDASPLWEMSGKVAMSMGLMQAVAVIPGLSRSGSTIFGGVVAKGNRESVAKFSFLLSVPIILGAVVLELYEMIKSTGTESTLPSVPPLAYMLGTAVAFAVGLFAIKVMLRVIQKANFKWFSAYLGIIGTITLICYFILGL